MPKPKTGGLVPRAQSLLEQNVCITTWHDAEGAPHKVYACRLCMWDTMNLGAMIEHQEAGVHAHTWPEGAGPGGVPYQEGN